ncbi:uncharacterized protein M421DRAFT_154059 [Didymella exigua CBS 183.55]|uniref:Uncharacterized protein n=1 Tax=Didymella exigua CBS 183.55 TaxID=1150837 RepID=A0A6A5RNM3_9PLEO|nr:uncharacterized protein M421DRAFT_154059 [Didymella exigua CBS 183.55]KAF1928738.1 hypothetical protein M421DRAFT_154059 [Didymella exigua CBS 183.55]
MRSCARTADLRSRCFSSRSHIAFNIMLQATEETSASFLSWPLCKSSLAQNFPNLFSKQPHSQPSHHKEAFPNKTHVDSKKIEAGMMPEFHLPLGTKSHDHRVPSLSRLSPVQKVSDERTVLSLDPNRRLAQYYKDDASSPGVRLRGGGGQHQGGKFDWLRTASTVNKTSEKSEFGPSPSAVTYKGKLIGPPQSAPALNALPPASRFAREPELRATTTTARSFLESSDCVRSKYSLSPVGCDIRGSAHMEPPILPPPPALLPAQSRSATTNPFAGVYGNPYAAKIDLTSAPVDYEVAGSLVDRPSALDGSQTGYDSKPQPTRRHPSRTSYEGPISISCSQEDATGEVLQQVRRDRKWDALPLPPEEGAREAHPKNNNRVETEEADYERFDTEELISSLRPERLSLYHIAMSRRPVNGSSRTNNSPVSITECPVPATYPKIRKHAIDDVEVRDGYSIRTRDWDLRSCNTDDLGVDTLLKRQEQLERHSVQHLDLPGQQRQAHVRDENEALYGLPGEDVLTTESYFYAEMIEIVNDYHEQLQQVIQRAYESGEIIEEHWLREKWRYKIAMDRKLRIAGERSGYKILNNEQDIKEAIKQPIGYAIYSSLLKIRDPETWQCIFKPTTTYSHLGTITSTSQQHATAQGNSLIWLLRKLGRGLRYMLAVPDDPDLKTYSGRHPPASASDTPNYESSVGVLGPNIPLRPLDNRGLTHFTPAPAPIIRFSLARSLTSHDQPRPSDQTERAPKLSADTTRVNKYTTFTDATVTSPLNHRISRATRSRGYEEGKFVTILAPSVVSDKSETTTAGYGAGKPERKQRLRDDRTEVTAWPEVEY